jgi:plastocyanin
MTIFTNRLDTLESKTAKFNNSTTVAGFGVTTIGDSTYIMGDNVYFGVPKTVVVTEGASSWLPTYVEVNVGDTVKWTWNGFANVYEVLTTDNATAVAGVSSGIATSGGVYSVQMLKPGVRRFRHGGTLWIMTVNVHGFGVNINTINPMARVAESYIAASAYVTGAAVTVNGNQFATSGLVSVMNGIMRWDATTYQCLSGLVKAMVTTHDHTATTGSAGEHMHTMTETGTMNSGSAGYDVSGACGSSVCYKGYNPHTHTVPTYTVNNAGAHAHSITSSIETVIWCVVA